MTDVAHDAGVLAEMARAAEAARNWADGPDLAIFQRLHGLTGTMTHELTFQTLLYGAVSVGTISITGGHKAAAESVLEAIAVEAQRRVDVLTAPAPEARPTTVEKMAYTAGYVDGWCNCPHKFTGQLGVSTGDEGPTP